MRRLLDAGANPELRCTMGLSVLLQAIDNGGGEAALLLIDRGTDVHTRGQWSQTTLLLPISLRGLRAGTWCAPPDPQSRRIGRARNGAQT